MDDFGEKSDFDRNPRPAFLQERVKAFHNGPERQLEDDP
jgi:hypothetical protein